MGTVKMTLTFDGYNRTYTLEGELADVLKEDEKLRSDPRFTQKPRIRISKVGVAAPSNKRYYEIESEGALADSVIDVAETLAGKVPSFKDTIDN